MTQQKPTPVSDRPVKPAIWQGWRCKCPACGQGNMLYKYLKVVDACESCGQELHHHRADDGPPYLTIMVVGHIIGPLMLSVYTKYEPGPLTLALLFTIGSAALSLFLLPRIKGIIVAVQWATRMGGFDDRT